MMMMKSIASSTPIWNLPQILSLSPSSNHKWELPGNYPVFAMVMVIYHYVERSCRILVNPNFLYNI